MSEPERYLRDLVESAGPGQRLPTVRSLMERFGVSQKIVQDAIAALAFDGLVEAYVGRGTFVAGAGGPVFRNAAKRRKSVIVLTRNVGSARTRRVLAHLQERLSDEALDVIQLTYSEPEHGLFALRGLPRVDLCIVQCHFETVSIELLAAVGRKSRAILFDGATISGLDVDSVASNWRMALEKALNLLISRGHEAVGMVGSSLSSRPVDAIRAHYDSLLDWAPDTVWLHPPIWVSELPTEASLDQTETALRALMDEHGKLPFTAMMIWGALNGQHLEDMFTRLGISVPGDLAVVVLGHRNVVSESNNFFTISGSSADETVDALVEMALLRMDDPARQFTQKFLPADLQPGQSTGDPD